MSLGASLGGFRLHGVRGNWEAKAGKKNRKIENQKKKWPRENKKGVASNYLILLHGFIAFEKGERGKEERR